MAKITISIEDEVAEDLNDHLEYGDNRSKWIQEAIEQRLERDGASGKWSPAAVPN